MAQVNMRAAATSEMAPASDIQVQDWVETNSQLFRSPPPGFHAVAPRKLSFKTSDWHEYISALLGLVAYTAYDSNVQPCSKSNVMQLSQLDAAVGVAALSDDRMGHLDLPRSSQPACYYRDVKNHANILTTIITTARRKAGFVPALSGQQFTQAEAKDYALKFSAWMNEMDSYVGYIDLVDWKQQTAQNDTTNCDVILKGVTSFVAASFGGLPSATAEKLRQAITGLIKSAAQYVVQKGSVVNAGFQLEAVDTTVKPDPIQAICYSSTIMRKSKSGKSISEQSSITLAAYAYKLNSAAIIAAAENLAKGAMISGAKQYCSYVNKPLSNST